MPYRALYRQWRPKDFSHVVGQRAVIDTLRNQVVNDRIAHAYLFCGSRGTGKTSTAKILAKAINCEHPKDGDPCGECENCLRMENDESLDVIEIDAASNNGVDEMRDLRDTVKYPPQFGKYKVYIIDEVHMLSTSAFNALLKTLEEPPAHIVFILATTEPQKLPETILSRCQRFDFGRLSVNEIQGRLREAAEGSGANVSAGALNVIARAAEGGMRDALSLLDMCLGYGSEIDEKTVRGILGTCDRSFLFSFADCLAAEDSGGLFRMTDRLMREGKDPAVFLKDISFHIRTLLLAKCCPKDLEDILDLTEEDAGEFRKQAEQFTVTRLMKIMDLFMGAENEMRYSSSARLSLENVCLKCCVRTQESDPQALNDRIGELEKKIEELNRRLESGAVQFRSAETPEKTVKKEEEDKTPAAAVREAAPRAVKTPDSFKSAWTETMKRMSGEAPSIWSMLTQGTASLADGNRIRWMPLKADGSTYYIETLNRDDKKERILQCLKSVTGNDYSFAAVDFTEKKSPEKPDGDDAYIEGLYKTFGKKQVEIREKL